MGNKTALKLEFELQSYFGERLYASLARVQRWIDRLALKVFRPTTILPSQAYILTTLARSKPASCPLVELDKDGSFTPAVLSRLIGQLSKKGFVVLSGSKEGTVVRLLPLGRAKIKLMRQSWRDFYHLYTREFGALEAAQFSASLRGLKARSP